MEPKITAVDAANFLGVTLQAVHKNLRKNNGLKFKKSQNRIFFGHLTARELFGLDFSPKIVAAQIVKGGTGKTSLIHSLAIRANLYGARTLCLDMDQQGNLTQAFQIDAENLPCVIDVINDGLSIDDTIINIRKGLDLIPSRIENAVLDNVLMLKRLPLDRVYRDRLIPLKDRYDLILIDCPPALGQSVAALALAADLIIAPVTPEKFSIFGLNVTTKELQTLEENFKTEIPIKVVLNKFDNRTILSHEILGTLLKHKHYGPRMFRSYIRTSQEFPNTLAKGYSIFDTIKNTPSKEDIDLFTCELLGIGEFSNKVEPAENLA